TRPAPLILAPARDSAAARATAQSLHQAGQVAAQQRAMTARLVRTTAEQGHASPPREAAHVGDLGACLRTAESGQIAPAIPGPVDLAPAEGAKERKHRTQLAEPDVDAALGDAAGPEAHDEHPRTVITRGRLVDALRSDPNRRHQ